MVSLLPWFPLQLHVPMDISLVIWHKAMSVRNAQMVRALSERMSKKCLLSHLSPRWSKHSMVLKFKRRRGLHLPDLCCWVAASTEIMDPSILVETICGDPDMFPTYYVLNWSHKATLVSTSVLRLKTFVSFTDGLTLWCPRCLNL